MSTRQAGRRDGAPLTQNQRGITMAHIRHTSRMGRLRHAKEKLERKIKDNPRDPSVENWRARIREYDQSMANLSELGTETPRDVPDGVNIDMEA